MPCWGMFFYSAYYLSNHNMQSFMALMCSLTMSDVLKQIDQKLPTESIFCAEWCCDTPSYNGEISPTRPSYNGDISPTSHASLTSQCLPLQLVDQSGLQDGSLVTNWIKETINAVAASLIGFDHPKHYFLLHAYAGQPLLSFRVLFFQRNVCC